MAWTKWELEEMAREWIGERAGILEYVAGFPRGVAERKAEELWKDEARRRREAQMKKAI